MPGIVGIINPDTGGPAFINAMLATMKHENFYVTSAVSTPEMNVSSGFAGFNDSSDGIFSNERGSISLVFSGECFAGSKIAGGEELIRLYEEKGPSFVAKLNGLFCGLLIDKQQRKILLFNDRYGIRRIYFHEKNGAFYFASEAKALLRVLPELRNFNPEGVEDFLAFGCTLDWKTLFQGIEVMPGGSLWSFSEGICRKEKYFRPETWESQPELGDEEFEKRLQETFDRILPLYFKSPSRIGIALTGGLDTRMIMSCRPRNNGHATCYTFSGKEGHTMDDQIAARVASASDLDHQLLRLDQYFFSNFGAFTDKTVFVTDGCAGPANAHEIYLNRKARELAPVRLTGNYGSEILRGVSTFKQVPLSPQLLDVHWRDKVHFRVQQLCSYKTSPMTFAAFKEIPWNLFGNLAAGQSQVQFRTPYLDNELVALAFQAPENSRKSSLPSVRLIQANSAALSKIPTDRGFSGNNSGPGFLARRLFAEATFKIDYYESDGMPHLLAPFESAIKKVAGKFGILGRHKFLRYRNWFRHELANYVRETFSACQSRLGAFWNQDFVKHIADEHIKGRKNYTREIHTVLTLDAVDRLLFRELPREIEAHGQSK